MNCIGTLDALGNSVQTPEYTYYTTCRHVTCDRLQLPHHCHMLGAYHVVMGTITGWTISASFSRICESPTGHSSFHAGKNTFSSMLVHSSFVVHVSAKVFAKIVHRLDWWAHTLHAPLNDFSKDFCITLFPYFCSICIRFSCFRFLFVLQFKTWKVVKILKSY